MMDFSKFTAKHEAIQRVMEEKGMTAPQAKEWLRRNAPKESYYQRKIMEWLKREVPGAFAWKAAQGAYSRLGIPDICVVYKGRFYGFEVKRPYFGRVTAMQEQTMKQIREAGGRAYVVTYPQEVAAILLPRGKR